MAKKDFAISLKLLDQNFKKGLNTIQSQLKTFKNYVMSAFAGMGVVGFGKQMIDAGRNFESGMARVKAVTNASTAEFKMMREEAQKLGRETKYSATEAAGALENLTRNGLTAEQATKALGKTLQLAQANSIELAEAADITTNVMNGFGMKVTDLNRINDVLSSTAAHSATNISELAEALKVAAPVANTVGLSIEETNAALGAMADAGIKGSDAGTAFKIMLQRIANQTPKASKELARLGVSVNETTLKQKGLIGVMQELQSKGATSLESLSKIFGSEAASKAAALMNNLDGFNDKFDTLKNAAGENARMFEQSIGQMDNAIATLKSSWEAFLISVFDNGEGLFVAPLNSLTEFVRFCERNLKTISHLLRTAFETYVVIKALQAIKNSWTNYQNSIISKALKTEGTLRKLEKERTRLEQTESALRKQIAQAEAAEKKRLEVQLNQTVTALQRKRTQLEKAESAARVANANAVAVQSGKAFATIGVAVKNLWSTLKMAFSATIWTAVIGFAVELVNELVEAYNESKRISNIWSEYKQGAKQAVHTEEIIELQTIYQQYQKAIKGSEERKALEKKLAEMLGLNLSAADKQISKEQLINNEVKKRIALLEAAAKAEYYTKQKFEADQKRREIADRWVGKNLKVITKNKAGQVIGTRKATDEERYNEARKRAKERASTPVLGDWFSRDLRAAQSDYKELDEQTRIAADASRELANALTQQVKLETPTGGNGGGTVSGGGGTGGSGGGGGHTGNHKKTDADKIAEAKSDYNKTLQIIAAKEAAGYVKGKEVDEERKSATETYIRALESNSSSAVVTTTEYQELQAALQSYTAKIKAAETAEEAAKKAEQERTNAVNQQTEANKSWTEYLAEKKKEKDRGFNQDNSPTGQLAGKMSDLGAADKRLASLQAVDTSNMSADQQAKYNLDVTEAKANIESLLLDIQNLNNQISSEKKHAQNFNDMASAVQNAGSAFSALGSAFESPALDVMGIIAQAIANIMLGYAQASAQAASMTPFGWLAFSIAGLAQVANVVAQIHSLSGYANGGIVQGNSRTGDKIIAGLNAGEAVLTTQDQAHLWNAIHSNNLGGGLSGNVTFTIEGSKLKGVLNNYDNKMSKGNGRR